MRYPPPGVFWEKRLDLLDSKGVDFFKSGKETTKRRQAIEGTGVRVGVAGRDSAALQEAGGQAA